MIFPWVFCFIFLLLSATIPIFPLIVTFVPFDHYREKNISQSQLCMNLSPIFSHNRVIQLAASIKIQREIDRSNEWSRRAIRSDRRWHMVDARRVLWRGAINRVQCETRGRKSEVGRVFLIRAADPRDGIPLARTNVYRRWPPRSKWHVIPRSIFAGECCAKNGNGRERYTWVSIATLVHIFSVESPILCCGSYANKNHKFRIGSLWTYFEIIIYYLLMKISLNIFTCVIFVLYNFLLSFLIIRLLIFWNKYNI